VIPGKPCHVTVTARGPDPAPAYKNVGVENTATFVLSFGQMTVSWVKDGANALEAPLSYAEVRFSDGVTKFKQYKTSYAADGMARASGASETKPVPKHRRNTLVLNSQDPISGPAGLRLARDATTEKAWRLAKRIEPDRTYMVMSAESVFQDGGETKAYVLTNRTKPATSSAPESLSRTPVVLLGDTLLPLRNTNAPASEPALTQDNTKFVFEEAKSPAAGPYAQEQGHTMQSFIHGTNVYPHVMFRGNGASGTIVAGRHSLITRQTNGQEGSQIAERAQDQAVWFNTPIDPQTGETKMFLYTGRDVVNQHYVLKEVPDGTTPNRDAGNAISQRQGSVGGFVAAEAASPQEATSVRLYAYDIQPYVIGDVNGDAQVTCVDLSAATAAVGKRTGQPGFVPTADMDQNGIIDVRDISAISRLLPAGTHC
jgi:hypothetical protein